MGPWLLRIALLIGLVSVVVGCFNGTIGKTLITSLLVAGVSTILWVLLFLLFFGIWNKPQAPQPGQKYARNDMDSWCVCAGACALMGDVAMFIVATGVISSIKLIGILN